MVELGQGCYDLSLQEYGSMEAVFMLLEDNPALDLLDNIEPGTVVKIRHNPPNDVIPDLQVMNWFRENEIRVNNQEYL